ncbi:ABC transporter permease [Jatrophihabitans sp. DSM 44399]|uniref:ABC transporter permease n=1 Tax=Jatrophihabitans lederbergiae TaxID=3075547 RepID=A0ABU2JE23_9ACTN|nr:ABC transporter permease [Jatrophihabitans sp. DSM 44399]MDT0263225.1 ABC transporter permease [Jatrophihabitans sp. DSM 44399]
MVIALSFLSPYFLTTRNLSNILSQSSDIGIMAAGAALVILIGGIDLSVAANLALTIMVSAWLYKSHGVPFALALLAGLLVGALLGMLNGLLSTYGRVQPFVATLATMSAALGMALVVTNGNTLNGFPTWFDDLTQTVVLGIPLQALVMIVIYLVIAFWLRYRPGGRALFAIGGNEEVARLSGLSVRLSKTWVIICSVVQDLGVCDRWFAGRDRGLDRHVHAGFRAADGRLELLAQRHRGRRHRRCQPVRRRGVDGQDVHRPAHHRRAQQRPVAAARQPESATGRDRRGDSGRRPHRPSFDQAPLLTTSQR